jgi:hypothetical protein
MVRTQFLMQQFLVELQVVLLLLVEVMAGRLRLLLEVQAEAVVGKELRITQQ